MKNFALFILACLGFVLSAGCASLQTSSVYDRSSETRMIAIEENIEDGLKSGALTPDQSRMYQATLKDIQTDYAALRGKKVSRQERESLQGRLDVLGDVVNKAIVRSRKDEKLKSSFWERVGQDMGVIARTEKPKEPSRGDRIIRLQKKIDNGINDGAFSLSQGSQFQAKLDYIRSTYLQMMEGGSSVSVEEKEVISRLLDSLESDLDMVPQL